MSRSKTNRCYSFKAKFKLFKPDGCRCCEEVGLTAKEMLALKLYSLDQDDQTTAALKLGVSQPTFARLIRKIHQKIASALVEGKSLKFVDGQEQS